MAVEYKSYSNYQGNSTSLTLPKPTGLTAGELMIAHLTFNYSSGFTITPPTGFTLLNIDNGGGTIGMVVYYKIASSADASASNFVFTLSTTVLNNSNMIRISGTSTTTPVYAYSSQTIVNDDKTNAIPTITPSRANSLLLWLQSNVYPPPRTASGYAIATSNPATITEVYDLQYANEIGCSFAYATRAETTATGNGNITLNSVANRMTSSMLFITPVLAETTTILETITTTDILKEISSAFSLQVLDTLSTSDIISTSKNIWTNIVKNITTWINQDKS